jgi:predicted nucleic-acid-binding protein
MRETQVVDANVILRFLLNDHPEQSEEAKQIISANRILLRTEVICEVVYVLQKVYTVPRPTISDILSRFLKIETAQSPDQDIIYFALELYGERALDFVDCILIGMNKVRGLKVASFDKKLLKHLT